MTEDKNLENNIDFAEEIAKEFQINKKEIKKIISRLIKLLIKTMITKYTTEGKLVKLANGAIVKSNKFVNIRNFFSFAIDRSSNKDKKDPIIRHKISSGFKTMFKKELENAEIII